LRVGRLLAGERRLIELAVEREANAVYEHYRRGRMKDGRRFSRPPNPYVPPVEPAGKVNTTDPDSRNLKAFRGYVQGYNAQAVVTEQQIVIAAEVNIEPRDFGHLGPTVAAAQTELANAGIAEQPDEPAHPAVAAAIPSRPRGLAAAEPHRADRARARPARPHSRVAVHTRLVGRDQHPRCLGRRVRPSVGSASSRRQRQ